MAAGARTADDLIAHLGLAPHPEGGWYRQIWAAPAAGGERPAWTVIHFLLRAGERSHWHRIDAEETWLYLAGAPLVLRRAAGASGPARAVALGPSPSLAGRIAVVEPHHWQAAGTTGEWSLVACTVMPGFRFDGFELAPPGFDVPA